MTTRLEPLPPREAIEYFRSKGYAPALQRFDWRDHWRHEHARAFVVAKAMQDDVLETIRSAVDDALTNGLTLDQFRADLRPKLEAFGWWGEGLDTDPLTGELRSVRLGSPQRLRVIYDTNLRTSYAAGRWARIQRTKRAFPYLEYRQIDRPTRREEHARFDGLIRPVDDPIWQVIYPPNGWFCGCSVRQVNDRMLAREGKRVSDPVDLETAPYTNPRTGETEELPVGVHPGFDTNPGATWLDWQAAHRATTAHLPDDIQSVDYALTEEIRARGLRDGDESLALYDLEDGEVIDWARSRPGITSQVSLSTPMLQALRRPGARMAAIHNHPSSGSFSLADMRTLGTLDGLEELVAVGLDGSIYRARATGLTPQVADRHYQATRRALQTLVNQRYVPPPLAMAVFPHIYSLSLSRAGKIEYWGTLSGRRQGEWAEIEELIETIFELIGEI